MLRLIKIDMLNAFLENRNTLPVFKKITNNITQKVVYKNLEQETKNSKTKVYVIYDLANYLNNIELKEHWCVKIIESYKGSMINLRNYTDVNSYLTAHFSSSRRSKFRTYRKRLETSFDITYDVYYGDIKQDKYNYLFKKFNQMIKARFDEKGTENSDLAKWEEYHNMSYNLINNKGAALFVISENGNPISIALNLIRGGVAHGYIRSYDINFAKFYLGFTDFINQLKWCFENNIEIFDLLKGTYAYKTNLIDAEYTFLKLVVYDSKSLLAKITATLVALKISAFYKMILLLKKINIHKIYHAILSSKLQTDKNPTPVPVISKIEVQDSSLKNDYLKVPIIQNENQFIKKHLYDFLYSSQQHLNSIEVYISKSDSRSYLFKGHKCSQTITFKKS